MSGPWKISGGQVRSADELRRDTKFFRSPPAPPQLLSLTKHGRWQSQLDLGEGSEIERTEEAQARTPWPQPITENSCSSPKRWPGLIGQVVTSWLQVSRPQPSQGSPLNFLHSKAPRNPSDVCQCVSFIYVQKHKYLSYLPSKHTFTRGPRRQGGQMGSRRFRRVKGAATCRIPFREHGR